jgi:hypothetical protein
MDSLLSGPFAAKGACGLRFLSVVHPRLRLKALARMNRNQDKFSSHCATGGSSAAQAILRKSR